MNFQLQIKSSRFSVLTEKNIQQCQHANQLYLLLYYSEQSKWCFQVKRNHGIPAHKSLHLKIVYLLPSFNPLPHNNLRSLASNFCC